MLQGWMDITLGDDIIQSLRRHLRYPDAPAARDAVPVRLVAPYDFTHTFRVKPPENGSTVLALFCSRFPFRSEDGWTQKLHDGLVLVNGQKVQPDYIVRQNDELSHRNIAVIEPGIPDDIQIVFENDHLIVIDKPAPVPVHAGGRYHKNTVISVLAEKGYEKLHVVHRLDAVTSGLLVFAKNASAANQLKAMFVTGLVEKRYEAIVSGSPDVDEVTISKGIKRRKGLEFMCSDDLDSKDAVTHFKVLERGNGWTRVECRPITGRTHQIRLHLRHWGFPIWDDPLYGPQSETGSQSETGQVVQMQNCAISLINKYLEFTVVPAKGASVNQETGT